MEVEHTKGEELDGHFLTQQSTCMQDGLYGGDWHGHLLGTGIC